MIGITFIDEPQFMTICHSAAHYYGVAQCDVRSVVENWPMKNSYVDQTEFRLAASMVLREIQTADVRQHLTEDDDDAYAIVAQEGVCYWHVYRSENTLHVVATNNAEWTGKFS